MLVVEYTMTKKMFRGTDSGNIKADCPWAIGATPEVGYRIRNC